MEARYNSACQKIGEYNNARQQEIEKALARIVTGAFENKKSSNNRKTTGIVNNSQLTNQTQNGTNKANGNLNSNIQDRIKQVEHNLKQEETYLLHAEKRYRENPSSSARMAVEAHKKAIEGYKQQIEDLQNNK